MGLTDLLFEFVEDLRGMVNEASTAGIPGLTRPCCDDFSTPSQILLDANEWLPENAFPERAMDKHVFSDTILFGLVSQESLAQMKPRTRILYDIFNGWLSGTVGVSYYWGRLARERNAHQASQAPLDDFIAELNGHYHQSFSASYALSQREPATVNLTRASGFALGLLASPVAFLTGLFYTPKTQQEKPAGYDQTDPLEISKAA